MIAHVVKLDDVCMPEASHGLGFAPKSRQFVRCCVGAGEQHLERNDPVQAHMQGLVDDSHPAITENSLDQVAGYVRQFGGHMPRGLHAGTLLRPGRREQRLELGLDQAQLLPAFANLRQQLGAISADLLRSELGVQNLVQQVLHPWLVGHRSVSTEQ